MGMGCCCGCPCNCFHLFIWECGESGEKKLGSFWRVKDGGFLCDAGADWDSRCSRCTAGKRQVDAAYYGKCGQRTLRQIPSAALTHKARKKHWIFLTSVMFSMYPAANAVLCRAWPSSARVTKVILCMMTVVLSYSCSCTDRKGAVKEKQMVGAPSLSVFCESEFSYDFF